MGRMLAMGVAVGVAALAMVLPGRAPAAAEPAQLSAMPVVTGLASWYGARYRGRRTASGEPFDPAALTAAHPSLPFDTLVEVRRIDGPGRVVVRINDRGPGGGSGRVIDVSEAAARALGMRGQGIAPVAVLPLRFE